MPPVPLETVLSRMVPQELCEALALLRWCARTGAVDVATAERLTRRILALPVFRDRRQVAKR